MSYDSDTDSGFATRPPDVDPAYLQLPYDETTRAPRVYWGTSSPESVVTGMPGDLFIRTDGGVGTTLYQKKSGSNTNTGWVPIEALGAIITFTDADTTPSVASTEKRVTAKTANTGATSITTFDDGIEGQELTILVDGNTTLVDGATLVLNGGANFVGTAEDIITLVYIDSVWYEKSRSVNG